AFEWSTRAASPGCRLGSPQLNRQFAAELGVKAVRHIRDIRSRSAKAAPVHATGDAPSSSQHGIRTLRGFCSPLRRLRRGILGGIGINATCRTHSQTFGVDALCLLRRVNSPFFFFFYFFLEWVIVNYTPAVMVLIPSSTWKCSELYTFRPRTMERLLSLFNCSFSCEKRGMINYHQDSVYLELLTAAKIKYDCFFFFFDFPTCSCLQFPSLLSFEPFKSCCFKITQPDWSFPLMLASLCILIASFPSLQSLPLILVHHMYTHFLSLLDETTSPTAHDHPSFFLPFLSVPLQFQLNLISLDPLPQLIHAGSFHLPYKPRFGGLDDRPDSLLRIIYSNPLAQNPSSVYYIVAGWFEPGLSRSPDHYLTLYLPWSPTVDLSRYTSWGEGKFLGAQLYQHPSYPPSDRLALWMRGSFARRIHELTIYLYIILGLELPASSIEFIGAAAMRLGVVTSGPFNNLPDELLTHRVDHSPDIFYKKSRPYVKITVPPGYTESQALCQQFVSIFHYFFPS
ncbi:hypothetical protein VP01_1653g1, partial [Puccinia sorghi]